MNVFKNTTPVIWILVAIGVFVSGITLLVNRSLAWGLIETVVAGLVFLVGVMYLISIFIKSKESKLRNLGIGVFCMIGGIALFAFPKIIQGTFSLVIGILGILIGVLIFFNAIKLRGDGASWMGTLFTAIIYIILGISMAFTNEKGGVFALVFGFYLIFFSLNIFGDAFKTLMHANEHAQKAKRHIRIALPAVIAAFLPIKMLNQFNEIVKEDPNEALLFSKDNSNKKPDLEVYIHTSEGLIPGIGHVDISFEDVVYSYGNYDDSTWKLGGFFADGVLVEMDPEKHIKEALVVEKKILMVYGLVISEEQKKGVEDKLNELKESMVPWESKAEQCEKGEIPGKPEDFKDVSSSVYNDTKARFFKFKKGSPFKTYYVVGTNCVKLADTIVGKSGIDLLRVNGIITPGTYLYYLDSLYERGDSIVVSRKLYSAPGQKSENEKEEPKA
ncbi:MAG: HdeD family acid-resistance protein [Eubacteriaceae bacterium]